METNCIDIYDEATLKLSQAESIIKALLNNEMVSGDAFSLVYTASDLLRGTGQDLIRLHKEIRKPVGQ